MNSVSKSGLGAIESERKCAIGSNGTGYMGFILAECVTDGTFLGLELESLLLKHQTFRNLRKSKKSLDNTVFKKTPEISYRRRF